MTYEATQCRFIERVGDRYHLGGFWGEQKACGGEWSHHQRVEGGDGHIDYSWTPTACDRCSAEYDGSEVKRYSGSGILYNTDDGKPHPGDMFWVEDYEGVCFHWDNCDGKHLHVILPDGHEWNVDGRASNCTMKDDRTHRCWVREGDPPNVTAGKAGHTCQAGAGSIATAGYHGFLQNGVLTRG